MGRIRDKVVRLHKKHCLALYLNVFLVLAFIAGYIAFAVTFRTQDRSQSTLAVFLADNTSSAEVVVLAVSLTGVTPADYTVKLQVDLVSVPPSWIGEDGTINKTFTIGIDSLETRISPSGRFRPITTTISMTEGSFDLYPFDEYEAEVSLYVYDGSSFETSNVDLSVEVNKAIVYGYSPSLKEFKHQDGTNSRLQWQVVGGLGYVLKIDRTSVFMLYPVFQIVAFWLIGLTFCVYASATALWNVRKIEGPVVAGTIGLIFALPAFRNTAPGSPPIGCTMDVFAFYWAMIFVVICFIGIVGRYVLSAPAGVPGQDVQLMLMRGLEELQKRKRAEEEEDEKEIKLRDIRRV